jgi:hypothetical protein
VNDYCGADGSFPGSIAEYTEAIIETARKFEAYSCGDLDAAAAEKLAQEKAAADKLAKEKLAADKLASEKLAQENANKIKQDKIAAEKVAKEKAAEEKVINSKNKNDNESANKLTKEKEAADKIASEKIAAEKAADEKNGLTQIKTGAEAEKINTGESKRIVLQSLGSTNKYKELIKRGDELFKMKRYVEAKPVFEDALKLKESDPYATNKLIEIDKLIKK